MKKMTVLLASLALVMSCLVVAGCSSESDAEVEISGTPALMPEGHEGRFENLGAEGCYGCHGANETANPMLATATALPADHYVGGDASSLALDPNRAECLTCHAQE